MNCQEFEMVMNDLTDTAALDAVKREAAKSHITNCKSCEIRLVNLQSLHAGLKALAATNNDKEASPEIETFLLAAFRQQTTSRTPAIATTADNIVSFPIRKRHAIFLAAAAAILLAIFAAAASQWSKQQPVKHQESSLVPDPSTTAPTDSKDVEEKALAGNDSKTAEKRIRLHYAKSQPVTKSQSATKSQSESPTADYVVTTSLSEFTAVTGNSFSRAEITTDFLPLTFEPLAQPIESGQVIRIEMPRRAMTSFGLPFNLEKADEPVTADVLLAEDGSARAIRFVR